MEGVEKEFKQILRRHRSHVTSESSSACFGSHRKLPVWHDAAASYPPSPPFPHVSQFPNLFYLSPCVLPFSITFASSYFPPLPLVSTECLVSPRTLATALCVWGMKRIFYFLVLPQMSSERIFSTPRTSAIPPLKKINRGQSFEWNNRLRLSTLAANKIFPWSSPWKRIAVEYNF